MKKGALEGRAKNANLHIYSYILLARKSRVYYFKNRFCNTLQPMRKSYLNCIVNMLFNDIHVQFLNTKVVSIGT